MIRIDGWRPPWCRWCRPRRPAAALCDVEYSDGSSARFWLCWHCITTPLTIPARADKEEAR